MYKSNCFNGSYYYSIAGFFFWTLKSFDSCVIFDLFYTRVSRTPCSSLSSRCTFYNHMIQLLRIPWDMSNRFSVPRSNRIHECITFFFDSFEHIFVCLSLRYIYFPYVSSSAFQNHLVFCFPRRSQSVACTHMSLQSVYTSRQISFCYPDETCLK